MGEQVELRLQRIRFSEGGLISRKSLVSNSPVFKFKAESIVQRLWLLESFSKGHDTLA